MSQRIPCGILGSGNIGTDLMAKLLRSKALQLMAVVGIDPKSDGLARARSAGVEASAEGVDWLVEHLTPGTLVFDATSASAHRESAPRMIEAGFQLIDLTPAKIGPGIVPVVNLDAHRMAPDVNLISCAGQASIPIVAAVARVSRVTYAEVISTVASAGAGPGTRQNIDEFTHTTAGAIHEIGGAEKGKAIVILNPADPPILMRNTVFCSIEAAADEDAIDSSIRKMVDAVALYVPGYRLKADPVFEPGRVAVFVEVEGAGDYLPKYAGNLDIMTAAAVRVAEEFAQARLQVAP
jgi:acetaldehyde dehydrogenase